MKTTTTLTLDPEVLAEAKTRFGNLSKYVNDFLKAALETPEDNSSLSEKSMEEQINILKKKQIILSSQLKTLRQRKIDEEKNVTYL